MAICDLKHAELDLKVEKVQSLEGHFGHLANTTPNTVSLDITETIEPGPLTPPLHTRK